MALQGARRETRKWLRRDHSQATSRVVPGTPGGGMRESESDCPMHPLSVTGWSRTHGLPPAVSSEPRLEIRRKPLRRGQKRTSTGQALSLSHASGNSPIQSKAISGGLWVYPAVDNIAAKGKKTAEGMAGCQCEVRYPVQRTGCTNNPNDERQINPRNGPQDRRSVYWNCPSFSRQ